MPKHVEALSFNKVEVIVKCIKLVLVFKPNPFKIRPYSKVWELWRQTSNQITLETSIRGQDNIKINTLKIIVASYWLESFASG
jgi:hypothetical protein